MPTVRLQGFRTCYGPAVGALDLLVPRGASEEPKVRQVIIASAVDQHLVWPGQPRGLDRNMESPVTLQDGIPRHS